ncbi:MAG TPA: asparagine synthase-related protein [Gemmatimonadota bacterium]|nr:asparagine synthase-related protein [Gemmatimonadota bacterium]
MEDPLPPLEPVEIASGAVPGRRSRPAPPFTVTRASTVREVLQDLLVPRLESAPCFVSFSGGRDSAALLALAVRLAKERGLEEPVPVTLRFEGRPRTDESDWQERTIDHLALREWRVVQVGEELDPLGPVATAVLRRHGLFWPPVAHRIRPLLDAARSHVLIMGTGGDEMFSPPVRHPARRRLAVRGRPLPLAARRAAFNLLPERLRIGLVLGRDRRSAWLRPAARRELRRRYRAWLRRRHPSWAEAIRLVPELRSFELTQAVFAAQARDADVTLVQPFFDRRFIRAIGESAPRTGFPSRAAAMALHFGDVLPPEIVARTTKAVFDELHGGRASREFASAWDGRGLDPHLVDPEALRREWLAPRPEYRSLTALNAAWLASTGGDT